MSAQGATFTEGSIPRHVAHLSGVMVLGFLAMTLGQLIEVFYVGQVGKLALAAITFTFPISMSLNALARGIGIGAATIIAQAMGSGNRERSARIVTHCYLLLIIFTVVTSLLGYFWAKSLFALLGATSEVLLLAETYAQIWLFGFPMLSLALVSNGLIRAYGNASLPGVIMALGPLTQVVLGPFFILGALGFPAMGLAGAAWAFVVGTLLQLLVVLHWYFVRERLFVPALRDFYVSAQEILRVGIPAAATNLIQPMSFGVVTWLLAGYGSTVVAAFGVASRLEAVASMVVIGISTAIVPLVGQNWGAQQFDRVRQAIFTCNMACLAWGVTAALLMWVGAGYFVSVINDDESLVDTAVLYLHIVPFSIGFMGLLVVSTHTFNALRRPLPALVLSITRLLVVYIPLALFASAYFGYQGVFVATAVTNVLVGIGGWFWARRTLQRAEFDIVNAKVVAA